MVHHMHIFHCQFLTNLSQLGQDTLRTSWHVSHIFWEHLVNATVLIFQIEIDRGAHLDKNTNVIFVQRVTGTTFEISLITKTKWNSVFCNSVVTVCNYTQTTGQKWPVVSRMVRRDGEGHTFLGDLLWRVMLSFCWSKGRVRTLETTIQPKSPSPPPPPPPPQ